MVILIQTLLSLTVMGLAAVGATMVSKEVLRPATRSEQELVVWQVGAAGVGVGDGVLVGVADGLGVGERVGVGLTVGLAVGLGVMKYL